MPLRFDKLVSALANAVIDAEHQVQRSNISRIKSYFYASSIFVPGDILDLPSLASKLTSREFKLSKFLVEHFSKDTKELLSNKDIKHEGARLKAALTQEFNNIIEHYVIYDQDIFSKINLRPETRALIEDNPRGRDLVRLNRMLLEDAFPKELLRSQSAIPVELQLPRINPDTKRQDPVNVSVPLITLVNHSQMSIQEMLVTMHVDMNDVSEAVPSDDKTSASPERKSFAPSYPLAASTTSVKKPGDVGMAHITLKVTAEETPEGLARLLDHLNKYL